MQKTIAFIFVLLSFAACTLDKLEPAQTKAFIKYFGDRGNTTGSDLIKVSDGYLLLGNNVSGGEINTVLIKVDLNGNQLWSNTFSSLNGSSLAQSDDGYFIIGDSINGLNPTSMKLIKTDLSGTEVSSTILGKSGSFYTGNGVAVSGNEVIVMGAISSGSMDSTFLYGYDFNLKPNWSKVRTYYISSSNSTFKPSKELIQIPTGQFMWTGLTTTGNSSQLNAFQAAADSEMEAAPELAQDKVLTSDIGGINISGWSPTAYVQTVDNGAVEGIAIANFDKNGETSFPDPLSPTIVTETGGNYYGHALVKMSNSTSMLILGSTDDHPNDQDNTRSDLDFFIQEVVFQNDAPPVPGFKNYIGGTGSETGVAIVAADDGGYVFLGTMRNTNDTNLMVLVKVNNNGELLN